MEVDLTAANFDQEVSGSKTPILVDFWATWCGPCKMVAPHLDKLAKDYAGRIKVCKLNIDEAPEIATQYSIMSIPALVLFKDGKIMEKRVGAMGRQDLEKFIQPYI